MKLLISSLSLISSIALAEEVIVTGYGNTYNLALENAKMNALERIASTFIIGERIARGNKVSEEITQYNGGIIKTHSIISHQSTSLGYEVTIKADVVPKNNVIKKRGFEEQLQEVKTKQKVIPKIENLDKAIHIDVTNPTYQIGDRYSKVNLDVTFSWQPKWITDTKSFIKVVDQDGSVSTTTHENISRSLFSTLFGNFGIGGGIAAVAVSSATQPEQKDISDLPMVCFDDICSTINLNLPKYQKLIVIGTINGKDIPLFQGMFNTKLYKHVEAGHTINHKWINRQSTTYNQPTLLIYENEVQKFPLTFIAENDIIKSVSSINVYLR